MIAQKRTRYFVLASIALLIAGLLITRSRHVEPPTTRSPAQPKRAGTSVPVSTPSEREVHRVPTSGNALPVAAPSAESGDAALAGMFSADANGRLVKNQQTRLNIEKLHALNTSEEFLAKLARLSTILPPEAHGDLMEVTKKYIQYITAQEREFPPEAEVTTVGEAKAELKGLHELRVKHFGVETTEAFFGEEERMSQRLLELMALEADEKLTLAEKAERAQQFLKTSEVPADVQK